MKILKAILLSALITTFSLVLSSCSKPATETAAVKNKDSLVLIVSTLNNPFFVSLKEGAEKKATELGYDLVVLDSQNNSAKELANIQDILIKKPKVILINPTDSDAVGNAVLLANKDNIPVITLDRAANKGKVISHIASDNTAGGNLAGDFIAQKIPNAKVIQLEGITGTSAARERGQGFAVAVKENNLNVIASQPADFDRTKGLNVMQNLLTAHPDVQAVFAQNDEMALGALRTLRTANKDDVLVVGFDGTDDGIKAVKDAKMAATVAQQPALIGEQGVIVADKYLQQQEFASQVPVALKLITVDSN